MKTTGKFCKHCNKRVMAQGDTPNHILHFFLSLFTFGLWLIVWLAVCICCVGGWRCTQCGCKV
jgi:hypothetical protein